MLYRFSLLYELPWVHVCGGRAGISTSLRPFVLQMKVCYVHRKLLLCFLNANIINFDQEVSICQLLYYKEYIFQVIRL